MPGCAPPIIVPTVEDLSAFEEFTYYRTPVWCWPEDGVLRADLRRMPDGSVVLEMLIRDPGADIDVVCPPPTAWADCIERIGRAPIPRALNPTEIERMQNLFQFVTVENVLWFPYIVEYCEIAFARWDGRELSRSPSYSGFYPYQALSSEQMGEIVDFIESLRGE